MHPSLALRMFRPTGRMMAAKPQPPQGLWAKTKAVPAELWPLIVVVSLALGGAGYSLSRKITHDKTMRLSRQGPAPTNDRKEEH